MNKTRQDLLSAMYTVPPRLEEGGDIYKTMHDAVYTHVKQNSPYPDNAGGVAGASVDALKRVKKMGFNPINILRYVTGAKGKTKGPLKFQIRFRPMHRPFRDIAFVGTFSLKNVGSNKAGMGINFHLENQPPRSSEMEYTVLGDTFSFSMATPMYELPGGMKIPPLVHGPKDPTTGRMQANLSQDRTFTGKGALLRKMARAQDIPPFFRYHNKQLKGQAVGEPRQWKRFLSNPQWMLLAPGRGRPSSTFWTKEVFPSMKGQPGTDPMIVWANPGPVQYGNSKVFVNAGDPVTPVQYDTWHDAHSRARPSVKVSPRRR